MKYKREPRTWRSSAEIDTESDVNDYEPLLSDASVSSRRSFGATCMFPDASETSDFESSRQVPSTSARNPSTGNAGSGGGGGGVGPTATTASRSPYFLQTMSNVQKDNNSVEDRISRFQYYSKIKNFIKRDDTRTIIPDHVVPSSVFVPYIPGNDQQAGKQSSLVTIFAVWNTIMGSSLLCMPWGIQQAGLANGIFLMVLVGAICLYTSYVLLRVQQLHGGGNVDWEVADMAGFLLGKQAEAVAKTFSLIVLLGANIVYWILMSNFLYHSVNYLHERFTNDPSGSLVYVNTTVICKKNLSNEFLPSPVTDAPTILKRESSDIVPEALFNQIWNLDTTVPLFLVLLIGPLVNFKSATFFTKFNSLGTLSVMYLLCFVLVKSIGWGIHVDFYDDSNPLHVPNFKPSFPALTGMLALALFIHNIIVTVMRNNRHQEKNGRDLSIAFTLVILTYLTIGVVFYISFPLHKSCIEANLLDNFQSSDILTVIARVFLFFQLVTVYPLIAYMLRVQLFTTLMKKIYPGFQHVLFLNCCIITICVLFAIFLPRIGTIIRFTGALSGFIYIFSLPSFLHLASLRKRGQFTITSAIFHLSITIFGLANLIAQFFVPDFKN